MFTNNVLFALGLAGSLAPVKAFFRMSCPGRVARERLDPILSPGGISDHVHTISGGSAFSANMTFEEQRAATCSSCSIKEDMSNYWTPQLYVKFKNGTFSPVPVVGDGSDTNGGMTVYYLQRGESKDGKLTEKLHAFPEGFRMLAGDPFKRDFTDDLPAKAINYACLGANRDQTNNIPNYNCPGGLRAQVFFPSCWNGKDLDSDDHRSHVSYPSGNFPDNGPCPPEFPVHLISIFFEILYDTDRFKNEWDGNKHPFVFAQGDPTGYGLHGDFINGWDVDVLQEAVGTCTNDSGRVEDCGAVTQFSGEECNACKLPGTVNEQVDGVLEQLPGCNPITEGPAPASRNEDCPASELGNPNPSFVDLTESKKWSYVGCGSDKLGSRAFTGDDTSGDDMTVEKCVDFCSEAGFSYAGLEFGRECFCNNDLPEVNAPKDGIMGSCTMRCAGDAKQFCGNAGALSIYKKCDSSCENAGGNGSGGNNNDSPAPAPAPTSPAADAPKPTAIATPTEAQSEAASKPANTPYKPATAPAMPASNPATPTKAPDCPRNNCVNQIFNPTASVSAKGFCSDYTLQDHNDDSAPIPTYLHNCSGSEEVSQACSCLSYYPTGLPKAKRRHARDM